MRALCLFSLLALAGCASQPLATVDRVELPRFMGDWYVIAHIPIFLEAKAYNAVESYQLDADQRTVRTTFRFNKGAFDGPPKTYHPTGFVHPDSGNAHWAMQFVWPLRSDYRVAYLSDDYQRTIIGRSKRDYVWIMARTPTLPSSDYDQLVVEVGKMGYDLSQLRKVPQQPLPDRTD